MYLCYQITSDYINSRYFANFDQEKSVRYQLMNGPVFCLNWVRAQWVRERASVSSFTLFSSYVLCEKKIFQLERVNYDFSTISLVNFQVYTLGKASCVDLKINQLDCRKIIIHSCSLENLYIWSHFAD